MVDHAAALLDDGDGPRRTIGDRGSGPVAHGLGGALHLKL